MNAREHRARRVEERRLLDCGEYPGLPAEEWADREWQIEIPPAAAARIARAQFVYQNRDGRLRCPVAERVHVEWERVNNGAATTRADIYRLLDTLTFLFPGPPPPGLSEERHRELSSEIAFGDSGIVLLEDETENGRNAAADILAVVLARRMSTSNDRRGGDGRRLAGFALGRGLTPADAKVALLREAVFLVAAIEGDLQTLRLGTSWETRSDGKKAEVRPTEDVSPYDFLRWFGGRSIREARKTLQEGPAASTDHVLLHDGLPGSGDSPLDALVAANTAAEAGERIRGLEALASGQQARILDAMTAAARAGKSGPEEIRRAAAENLGITLSTLRTQLQRLREKERQAM